MASTKLSAPTLPKSGAISKGYNFASNWEQNAPLTDQQQAAILTLSHAVAERPFPPNHALDHVSHPDKALFVSVSVSDEDTPIQDSGSVIQPFLVNTNQFYKWFTGLESAMKSEVEMLYQFNKSQPKGSFRRDIV